MSTPVSFGAEAAGRGSPTTFFLHQRSIVIRWIAFDAETAVAIDSHFARPQAEIQSGDALTLALRLETPSVILLPSPTPGKVILARVQPEARTSTPTAPSITYEASGFLGLSDSPVFLDDPQPSVPKKHWWQRKKAI